mmetsp:Transcript_27524/g.88361  ORF Transcript_27524/g.88361 Transcript_27524/m.88361 type:complete len:213 (+) Transcript_27524:61-699(+)
MRGRGALRRARVTHQVTQWSTRAATAAARRRGRRRGRRGSRPGRGMRRASACRRSPPRGACRAAPQTGARGAPRSGARAHRRCRRRGGGPHRCPAQPRGPSRCPPAPLRSGRTWSPQSLAARSEAPSRRRGAPRCSRRAAGLRRPPLRWLRPPESSAQRVVRSRCRTRGWSVARRAARPAAWTRSRRACGTHRQARGLRRRERCGSMAAADT